MEVVHFSLVFDTFHQLEQCVSWCENNNIHMGCPFLDNLDDEWITAGVQLSDPAGGLIFECQMQPRDALMFRLTWAEVIVGGDEVQF